MWVQNSVFYRVEIEVYRYTNCQKGGLILNLYVLMLLHEQFSAQKNKQKKSVRKNVSNPHSDLYFSHSVFLIRIHW